MPLCRRAFALLLATGLSFGGSAAGHTDPRDTGTRPARRPATVPARRQPAPRAAGARPPRRRPARKASGARRRASPPPARAQARVAPRAPPKPAPGKGRRKGLRGVRLVRGPDGHLWTRFTMHVRQHFSFLPGLGYAFGLSERGINHLLVQAAFGVTLYGQWSLYKSRTRMSRVVGHGAYAHLGIELGIPLSRESLPTHLAFPVRLQQVFAFGRHALMLVASLGPRWDLLPGKVGLQVTFGVGYTLLLPPAGIPVLVEAVHQSYGAYERDTWGLRVMLAWPLTW